VPPAAKAPAVQEDRQDAGQHAAHSSKAHSRALKVWSMAERLAPSGRHAFVHQDRKIYEWDQTLSEVNMYVEVPPGMRAKEMFCEIEKQHVKFGLKGNPPFMDVSL